MTHVIANNKAKTDLDSADLNARFAGNPSLLIQIIRVFLHEHAQTAAAIERELDRGDRLASLKITHALKGTAGTLALYRVYEEARGFEHQLENDETLPRHVPSSLTLALESAIPLLKELCADLQNAANTPQRPKDTNA